LPRLWQFPFWLYSVKKKNIEDGNIEHKKAKIGIIVVEVFGITGFKLGITTRKLEQRYKFDIRNIIFEYELNEIDAINLEMYLHEKFLDYRDNAIFYEGMNNGKRWNGDTEIYTKEGIKLILEELKKSINELNQLGNEFWEDKEFHIPHGLEAPLIKQEKGIFTTSKKVICLNSSKIYESITEAAKDIGTSQGNISMVCKGLRKHAKGMKFSYYDEDKTKNEIIEKQNAFRKTKVKCVEKNEIFSSITEAS